MKRVKLHRSASLRMAVLFVGLFAVCTTTAFFALYWKISEDLDAHQKSDVLELQRTLVKTLSSGEAVVQSVDGAKRLAAISDEDTVYLLTDSQDQFILGNVQDVPRFSGWKLLPWSDLHFLGTKTASEPEEGVLGLWIDVPAGHLFTGTSDGDALEARSMLVEGLGLALAVAVAVAVGSGIVLGRRVHQRIDAISAALDAASNGDLTQRIKHRPKGDELDHVSERINATLDRLQSSVASLRQVTADIAHDLKSPIGRIKQRLLKASDAATSAPEYQVVVETTVDEIDIIVETFNAILNISQIEGGLPRQRFSAQSLRILMNTVVDAYAPVAEDAGQVLSCNLAGLGNIEVQGDKDLLVQLFTNLVENAIRHCPTGSHIEIVADLKASTPVVTISDNGPGIPVDERLNVFRRLYRLEKSRTTPGSGLGLSLVAAIADLHDAKVELHDNAPGLRVEVRFPATGESTVALAIPKDFRLRAKATL